MYNRQSCKNDADSNCKNQIKQYDVVFSPLRKIFEIF